MSWGSGAGGFIIYFGSLLFRFIPLTVSTLRLTNAIIQVGTLLTFFLFLKRSFSKEVALLGLAYLAMSPWHLMLSRWNLDANQVFSLIMIGLFLHLVAMDKKQKRWHFLSLSFFSLAMYSYGSGVIVVPMLLALLYGKAWWDQRMTMKGLIGYGSWFSLISSPLITFYIINAFQLPAIITPWFSIPLFNVLRANSVIIPFDGNFFTKVWTNLGDTLLYLTTGKPDWLWNQLPGYGVAFLFTFPLLIVGLFTQRHQRKSFPFYAWFGVSFLFSLILYQNINRMGILFLPMIYFHVQGLAWLIQKRKWVYQPILGILATAVILFHVDYATIYAEQIKTYFAHGYGEALTYALRLQKTDYRLPSQGQVNGSHVLALFYIQPDPHDVVETGVYLNPGAEFQYLASFASEGRTFHFIDPTPSQYVPEETVYVIRQQYESYFNPDLYQFSHFHQFIVIY
jgi:hypothetical protein